jgi:serine/threonine protein kinase
MIAFACPSCGKKLSVKDESAGKKAKCPGCGQSVPIPSSVASSAVRDKNPAPQARASVADARTLPPESNAAVRDSVSGDETQGGEKGSIASSPAPEHYDFLAPPQTPDEIGRLGPFRILKVLGAGGMGVVFKAEDPQLGRAVAIKAMLPALAVSPSAKQRFLREARATAAIKHDHIVSIYQVGEDRNVPFLAMEFLEGEPLDNRLKRDGKLPPAEVLRITREVADGLAAAHERGLIHRDIKPANIWLEAIAERGTRNAELKKTGSEFRAPRFAFRVKILDFGLARATADESHLTQTGAIVGTPAYMAPEQANGTNPDARCDLFSLGCVVYRMCTGQQAFKGNDTISTLLAVATQEPTPVQQLNAEAPPALAELVMKLLAKDPAKRPQSAAEVIEAIQAIEAGQDQKTTVSPSPLRKKPALKKSPKPYKPAARARTAGLDRRWWYLGGGVAAALLLLVLILVIVNPFGGSENNPVQTPPPGGNGPPKPVDVDKAGDAAQAKTHQEAWAKQLGVPVEVTNSIGMKFRIIPPGEFLMGCTDQEHAELAGTESEKDRFPTIYSQERPQHQVSITQPFALGLHEVTTGQFRKFVEATGYVTEYEKTRRETGAPPGQGRDCAWNRNLGYEPTGDHPVVYVTWNDAVAFCDWLSKKEGVSYRLPTEAEWEYACRAGTQDVWAGSRDSLKDRAQMGTPNAMPVGQKQANPFGLFDMQGNIGEWCADWFDAGYYASSPQRDPAGPEMGQYRIVRGGTFGTPAHHLRPGKRGWILPDLTNRGAGFRVVRALPAAP